MASIRNWFDNEPHDYSPYRIIDEKSINDLSKIEDQIVDPGNFDIFSVETEDKRPATQYLNFGRNVGQPSKNLEKIWRDHVGIFNYKKTKQLKEQKAKLKEK